MKINLFSNFKKFSELQKGGMGSPLVTPMTNIRHKGCTSFNTGKLSPLVKKLMEDSENPPSKTKKFKFGVHDVVDNSVFFNKNAEKKKKKRIEDEYKIDVSSYPPCKGQIKLQAMQKELDNMGAYNQRQIWKIRRMRKKRKPKQVVIRQMNLNQSFQTQEVVVKEVKKEKPRKAPLSVSHGGPTKILKKASKFVEKDKIGTLMNMDMIFENLKNSKEIAPSTKGFQSTGFSRMTSPPHDSERQDSPQKEQRAFLQLISDRITKKMFLAKQKLRFLHKMVSNKKGKVIYEGATADNLVSLNRKIELFQEMLRHIRERSLHRIHLNQFKNVFQDDEETLGTFAV